MDSSSEGGAPDRAGLARPWRRAAAELGSGRDKVGGGELDDVARHAREQRIGRVLRDHQTAALMDRQGAGRAVVEHPGEHHTDHPRPECPGCRAEKGIDRGPVATFVRAAGEQHVAVRADKVAIRPGDEDRARRQMFARHRNPGGKLAGPLQDVRQHGSAERRHVQDDQHGGGKICREAADHCSQCFDPAGGCTDQDHVPACRRGLLVHARLPSVRLNTDRTPSSCGSKRPSLVLASPSTGMPSPAAVAQTGADGHLKRTLSRQRLTTRWLGCRGVHGSC